MTKEIKVIQEDNIIKTIKNTYTLNGYINYLNNLGFDVIWSKLYKHKPIYSEVTKNEYEYYFFHNKYSIFIRLDTINTYNINSADLYCQATLKNKNYKNNIFFNHNRIKYSNVEEISIDLIHRSNSYINELINNYYFLKKWKTINYTHFHSYLSHDDNNQNNNILKNSWIYKMVEKIKKLPNNVQVAFLENLSEINSEEELYIKEINITKNYFIAKEIIENIDKDFLVKPYLYDNLFDIQFSENYHKAIIPEIKELFYNKGVTNPENFVSLIMNKAFITIEMEDKELLKNMKKILHHMDIKDLEIVKNIQLDRNWYKHHEEIFNTSEKLIDIKKIQEKIKNFN